MSFFGSVINTFVPGAGDKFDNAVNDVGNFVNDKIIEPIKQDPVRFIVIAAAYTYGIPGLEFAGAGTATATGIAAGTYSLAQGKSFDAAVKDGLTTAAFTAAGNYVKKEFFAGTPTSPGAVPLYDANGVPYDASGPPVSLDTTVDGSGSTSGGFEVDGSASSAPVAGGTELSGADLPPASNPVGPPTPSGLEMQSLDTRFPTQSTAAETTTPAINKANVQMNTGQGSIYEPYVPEPDPVLDQKFGLKTESNMDSDYKSGSGKQPATGGDKNFAQDPDYPNNPNMRVRVANEPTLPEVVDYSRVASPDTGALSLSNVGDAALAAGENAYSFAAAHPYYTLGGLALVSSLGKDDKKKDDQPTGTPDTQIGDSRFYTSLPQLEMKREYNPYTGDYSTYAQTEGTHKFLSDPVYEPIDYTAKDGGFVRMEDGGYMGGGGLSPQLGAPQPQMMPQQPMPQGQQAPMPQQSPLAALGGAQANRGAMPQRPTGALQKVPMQQQNPNYRYFNYGAVPPSVQPTMQQSQPSQRYATGGLAMAHGGNVADGRTDNIHAMLSPGEYVMDAETVALLGNGNGDAGAKRLDQMREAVRKQKGGALSRGKISPDAQSPLTYLSGRMA